MPKVSKRRSYGRRMTPYKRRRANKTDVDINQSYMQKLSVPRRELGFPENLVTKLRYSTVVTLTSSAQAVAKYVFCMNSVYDPDVTNIGHQPYFYDQFTPVYARYVVLGSKLTAKFSPISNTTSTTQPSGPMVIGLIQDSTTSTPAAIETLCEASRSKSDFLNIATGGNNVKTISQTYSPAHCLGTDHEDDQVSAATNTTPNRPYYCHVFMAESGLATSSSCNVKVDIEYTVRFTRMITNNGS